MTLSFLGGIFEKAYSAKSERVILAFAGSAYLLYHKLQEKKGYLRNIFRGRNPGTSPDSASREKDSVKKHLSMQNLDSIYDFGSEGRGLLVK